jgi:hypothetical protein
MGLDSTEALDRFSDSTPDVIVSDIGVPRRLATNSSAAFEPRPQEKEDVLGPSCSPLEESDLRLHIL